ncbi:HAAS signaling domain-containing protein [Actinomadura violacea]|uniref:DUF1707 domain-containing protein n=1 Tax=Actinomadura violacea TaxID=2819934 RepID=A0ABS3S5V8_9ACTN|nr:hypothetical protein [Actinomadura violacea]MBO2464398.1 hypothetical protein [Actinomadura violacea]
MTTPYLDDLAERLRDGGVPEDEVSGTVDDLAAHIAETGAAPEEEFGPVEEFAAGLVAERRAATYAPAKRFFKSKRFYTFVSCYAAFVIVVCGGWIAFGPAGSRTGFLVGFLLGAVIAAVLMTVRLRQEHRRG